MKSLVLSVAAVAALAISAGSAAAQCPTCCDGCGQSGGGHILGGHSGGWHPIFAKMGGGGHGWFGYGLFGGKPLFCNHGSLFGDGHGGSPGQIPVVDPRSGNAGQLVFPQNPFIRGPRDYFMYEDR